MASVQQIYALVNSAAQQALGASAVVNEDLSNVVDIGQALIANNSVDNYVKALVNVIGKTKFVDRPYPSIAPSILMDGWRYGLILRKVRSELPDAKTNEAWNLTDGTSYDPFIFSKPTASEKFFYGRDTFRVQLSVADEQVAESFHSAEEVSAFISMLTNEVNKKLTVAGDNMIFSTIANAIGQVMAAGKATQKVNLLSLYKTATGSDSITAANALYNPDFMRFATYTISRTLDLMRGMNVLYNNSGTQKFTPPDRRRVIYLSDFIRAAEVYLYDGLDQFKDEGLRLTGGDVVPYWQGMGTSASLADRSSINVKVKGQTNNTTQTYIMAVAFDEEALVVANLTDNVGSAYTPRGRFTNFFYDRTAGYLNDLDEQFVVFYLA